MGKVMSLKGGGSEASANSGKSQTIIRIDPTCNLIPHLAADNFRTIQGVHEVHTDATGKTIRIVFDGMQETIGRLADYLCSCRRKPRCGASRPCNSHSERQSNSMASSIEI